MQGQFEKMIRSRTNTSRIAQRSQQIKTIIQNKPTKKSNIKTNILLSTRIENLKQATTKNNNNNKQHTQVNKKENTNVEAPNQKQHKTTSNENTATKHKSNNTTQHNKQE